MEQQKRDQQVNFRTTKQIVYQINALQRALSERLGSDQTRGQTIEAAINAFAKQLLNEQKSLFDETPVKSKKKPQKANKSV